MTVPARAYASTFAMSAPMPPAANELRDVIKLLNEVFVRFEDQHAQELLALRAENEALAAEARELRRQAVAAQRALSLRGPLALASAEGPLAAGEPPPGSNWMAWMPGGSRVPLAEKCPRLAGALWRVARRYLATAFMELMSNKGLTRRSGRRSGDQSSTILATWSWRPEPGGLRPQHAATSGGAFTSVKHPARVGQGFGEEEHESRAEDILSQKARSENPQPSVAWSPPEEEIREIMSPLKFKAWQSANASELGVSGTLDRLKKARQVIRSGELEPQEDPLESTSKPHAAPSSPLSHISTRSRVNRTTIADQAALQAQVSELQKYMETYANDRL